MTKTRCSSTCSTALEPPPSVWGLKCRSHPRSERLLPPFPAPRAPPSLSLQFLLQFIEEAPVRALGDELLGAAFDHPGFVQAQVVKAHGILGVILAPLAVGNLLHGLEGVAVVLRVALVYQKLGSPLRLEGTDVG